MDMDDIKQMALKLSMLIDSFEKRGDRVEQIMAQAAQAITQASKNSEAVAERTTSQALKDFRQTAATQLGDGLRAPVEHASRTLQTSMHDLQAVVSTFVQQQGEAKKSRKRDAWKIFIASTLASAIMLGGSIYAIAKAREETTNARWISGVNAAVEEGKLAPCEDAGVCVYANKQWIRLDNTETPPASPRKKK
jgi:hypothetical protein